MPEHQLQGQSVEHFVSVTLTPSKTRTLGSTPVELVPDPGPGYAAVPTWISLEFIPNDTPFDFYWSNQGSRSLSTWVYVWSCTCITGGTGNFAVGDNITGVPSGKAGIVLEVSGGLPTLIQMSDDNNPILNGDTITGDGSGGGDAGATATFSAGPTQITTAFQVGEMITEEGTGYTAKAAALGSPSDSGFPGYISDKSNEDFGGNGTLISGGTSGAKAIPNGAFQYKYAGDIILSYSGETGTPISSVVPKITPAFTTATLIPYGFGGAEGSLTFIVRNNAIMLSTASPQVNWATVDDDAHGNSQIRVNLQYVIIRTDTDFSD